MKASGRSAFFAVLVMLVGALSFTVACYFARMAGLTISDWPSMCVFFGVFVPLVALVGKALFSQGVN